MTDIQTLGLLIAVALGGGVVGGIGGPGGIPVILTLNLSLSLSSATVAATTSAVFVVASATATGLYRYSDGIEWGLAATVGVPALVGTHVGTRIAASLSVARFESVLGVTLLLAAVGIVYQQRRPRDHRTTADGGWRARPIRLVVAVGSLLIGVLAGITGLGGPALTVPFLLVLGVAPVTAIGAGLASAVLITVTAVVGHVLQGNPPALVPALAVGVPYVLAQLLGWKFVHSVSERTVAYVLAVVALGGVAVIVL